MGRVDKKNKIIHNVIFTFAIIIVLSFFIFAAVNIHFPAYNLWNVTFNGPQDYIDSGQDIVLDSSGNIYVVGYSYWSSALSSDIYLGKFNSSGSNLWNATINGLKDSFDAGYGVAIDSSGNIYVTGYSYWSSALSSDIYLGKFNSSGSNLWNATINGLQDGGDTGYGIVLDSSGNIYVTGYSVWGGANADIYLGKFNSSGSNVWNSTLSGPQNSSDVGYSVTTDSLGNIYVTGGSYWSSALSSDIYLGKFNSSGSNLWNATINGPQDNSFDAGYGVAIDSSENIYVVGSVFWSSAVSTDIYLGKFNSSGSNLWNKTINGPADGDDRGYGIKLDNNSNIYITGFLSQSGAADIYLGKFNSSGSNLWNKTINDPLNSEDYGYGITIDSSGNIYVTGYSVWSSLESTDIYLGKFYEDVISPTITSFTCAPSPVYVDESITCSCSATDDMSGVTTSFTTNPSTSNTGTFSTECTATDVVGNTASTSTNYEVRTHSSSPLPPSPPTPTTPPVVITGPRVETTIPEITPQSPAEIDIDSRLIGLTKIIIESTDTINNVSLEVTRTNEHLPEANFKIGLPTDGHAFEAFHIDVGDLDQSKLKNVTIEFRVDKSWVDQQRHGGEDGAGSINLYRQPDGQNDWITLETTLVGADENYYYYTATSPGFSNFLVFFSIFDCIPDEKRCIDQFAQSCFGNHTWVVTDACPYGCADTGCKNPNIFVKIFSKSMRVYTIAIISAGFILMIFSYILFRHKKNKKIVRSHLR